MKKTLFLLLLLFQQSFAQNGITWVKGNLRTAFDLAKSQNKPVFIEVYSNTCHVCQSFMPVLDSKPVGDIYNGRFVSYKLEIGSPEANAFLLKQKIWIPSLPLFLFFDKDINLQHIAIMGEGMNNTQVLSTTASTALDANKRMSGFAQRYAQGNREPAFLIDYAYMSRIRKDTLMNMKVAEAYAKTQKMSDYDSQTNFLVLQKIVLDSENPMFQYVMKNLGAYQQKYGTDPVKTMVENVVMSSLFSSRCAGFSPQKIKLLGEMMVRVGIDRRAVENRTLIPELTVWFKNNQAAEAIKRIERYIATANPGPQEYEFLSSYVRQKTTDKAALAKANEWAKKAGK